MGNKVLNASGLDGVTDWTGATSVDEETRGAEGRIVIVGSGGSLRSNASAVTVGAKIEAAGAVGASGGSPALQVEFLNGGGSVVLSVAVPRRRAGDGNPRRGLPETFDLFRGELVVPAGAATARIRATGSGAVYLLKPWLETAAATRNRPWQVGPHSNPDLLLPVWPSDLPAFQDDGFAPEPIPRRGAFAGDTGIPITRDKFATPRYSFRGSLRLDMEETDRLMVFARSSASPFWFMRQDTLELCRAYWLADGEPTPSGIVNGRRRVTVGLLLEVS